MLPARIFITFAVVLIITQLAHAQDTLEHQLQDAAFNGNLAEVKRLVAAGADTSARKEPGSSPLYCATVNQHEEVALFLIERGAALNRRGGPKNDTPLMNAASFNELSVIRALLRRGAKTNLRCDEGMTAREHAVLNHHPDAVKLLGRPQTKLPRA